VEKQRPDQLLTAQEVVDELQGIVTVRTVTNWCAAGRLRARRAGKKWLIRRADLESFLDSWQGGEGETKKAEALAA
jgi:excisionase family DNA binding protein